MPVNWNLGVMPDVGGNALAAFKTGQQERQQADQRNAMAAYAISPEDPQALNALAPHNPEFVVQRKQQMAQQQQANDEKQLVGAALTGDPVARHKLAYTNSEMYLKLGENEKKQLADVYERVGQGAWSILQMPEGQRGPALQQFLQQMQIDPSQLNLTGDATQDLKMALAYAGKLDDWERFAEPKYTPVGEAGLAGFQFGKPIMQGGQAQNFGPPAPAGVTFTPIDGGPAAPAGAGFRP